ncbi:MAG: archaemetzincin family Zn-dependent metalloprotease [Deltaproteobacteria bacterium]|nr:archaemetzincin family Zn-dependent metalloprotease [Deltaproteobacteria bacterium]
MTICPLGSVEDEILSPISTCIEEKCGLTCRFSPQMGTPKYAYDKGRLQYNAKLILRRLITQVSRNTFKFMGVTQVDLFIPILKYVFGVAQMEGSCSVISTHRLRPQFYDQPPNQALFLERVQKTALHELGHCFGLTHCRNRHCVMYSSTRIEDTDSKKIDFCPSCKDLFQWQREKECNSQ